MGKGDKKSKRGKIIAGSYGKKRPRKASVASSVVNSNTEKVAKEAKSKTAGNTKTEKVVATKETKPKAPKTKKTED